MPHKLCVISSCQFPSYLSLAPLRCSPQALQAAAVSSESPETQEEREKAWRRGGRQPEISIFCLFEFVWSCSPPDLVSGELMLLIGLTMVGELAAPLPGTARGLTVQPFQDKLLQRQEMMFFLLQIYPTLLFGVTKLFR